MDGVDLENKCLSLKLLTINFPDGKQVQSTHKCNIHIPGLSNVLIGHIILHLEIASLIGIRLLCKAGCKVIFDDRKCDVVYNGNIILQGFKDPSTNMWMLPIPKGGVGTTHGSDSIGPHSAHMVLSHQVGHADAPTSAKVLGKHSPCMITGNLATNPTLPRLCPPPFPPSSTCHVHALCQHSGKCGQICTSGIVRPPHLNTQHFLKPHDVAS
jgi:hypothetical protein